MNRSDEPLYSVTLRQLSPDARRADADLPDTQLPRVSAKRLRALLETAAALAPDVAYPIAPELRIAGATGKFVVQLKGGNLHFVSWSSAAPAVGKLTPAQIVTAITGEPAVAERPPVAPERPGFRQSLSTGMLVVAIVAVNSFTLWFVTQPPKTLLPNFTLMSPGHAERLLTDVAGVYETGGAPGDRRLEIRKDGAVERIRFGSNRTAVQQQSFTVQAVEADGRPALVTNRHSLIAIKNPLSVVLFGDTYRRITR